MIRFDLLTLFPEMFASVLGESILKRAVAARLIEVRLFDFRDWAAGRHQQVDDVPYGGGDGMVLKPEPLAAAIRAVRADGPAAPVTLLTPQGRRLDQTLVQDLAGRPRLILVCGRYAGVDERVRRHLVDEELSIGDYVLSGGELPALVVIEAVARQVPGVLGNQESAPADSFPRRLEAPQYTRPVEFESHAVPEVLVSGHHQAIRRWRQKESLRRTLECRPDLLEKYPPDGEEAALLEELAAEPGRS
jgi:tRNA (guanine37-N1)-methyltransferase